MAIQSVSSAVNIQKRKICRTFVHALVVQGRKNLKRPICCSLIKAGSLQKP